MRLLRLLIVLAITAAICGFAGLSRTTTVVVTLVVGAIAIVLGEKYFPDPWKPLERLKREVPDDHPLLVEAKRRAVDSLPLFWSLCANGVPMDAKVRVQMTNRSGDQEELWMFVRKPPDANGQVHVHLYDCPRLSNYDFNDAGEIDFSIHESQIVDWTLEQADGRIRGAFTTFALLDFFEQNIGPLPERTNTLRERFVDAKRM